jgi:hypothetical protein
MRSPDEIQQAHDRLHPLVTGEVLLPLGVGEQQALRAALDVLCWVLDHDHNRTFSTNLVLLDQMLQSRGFILTDGRQPDRRKF